MTRDKSQTLAVIVGIAERGSDIDECERSLDELTRLLDTAGADVCARVIQVKESFDPRTCIGSGKVKEVSELCTSLSSNLVVFDFELTPAQIRNLEADIGGDITVIDRSMLILDIFALHAVSGEGKLQVELAQLRYSAPRLMGKGKDMSRLGGGIGTRGPGETKLESDRRHLKEKVVALERRLAEMEHNRSVMRASRDRSGLPKIAIVGYTNAGKSTLLNALTDAGVLSEDKLFATLDPTTRKLELPSGEQVLLTDTVGFIRKLPHHLVKAFKSTLDEVVYADVLMIVSDATDSELPEHLKVTEEVIEELGASGKPTILVYNKCDMLDEKFELDGGEDTVAISAKTGERIERLLSVIEAQIARFRRKYKLFIPYTAQSAFSAICTAYSAENIEYTDTGVSLTAVLDERGRGLYAKYITQRI